MPSTVRKESEYQQIAEGGRECTEWSRKSNVRRNQGTEWMFIVRWLHWGLAKRREMCACVLTVHCAHHGTRLKVPITTLRGWKTLTDRPIITAVPQEESAESSEDNEVTWHRHFLYLFFCLDVVTDFVFRWWKTWTASIFLTTAQPFKESVELCEEVNYYCRQKVLLRCTSRLYTAHLSTGLRRLISSLCSPQRLTLDSLLHYKRTIWFWDRIKIHTNS